MLYAKALAEKQRLDAAISFLKKEITGSPNGTIICTRDGNFIRWYQSIDGRQNYISKKNRPLAEQLATKKYYSLLLEDFQHERTAIEFYLKHHKLGMGERAQKLSSRPEYQELLLSSYKSKSEELFEWGNALYPTNPQYPENLIYQSTSGVMMRSKSETIIDMYLCMHQIPHRYECELTIGGKTIYPDFTIRHPITGEIYYWEHFGMMDTAGYRQNAVSKLQFYTSHQIFPGLHLITTYESQEHPLDIVEIQNLIQKFFL